MERPALGGLALAAAAVLAACSRARTRGSLGQGRVNPLASQRERIAHLFRRAGFGATPQQLDEFSRRPYDDAVEYLVNYEQVPDDLEQRLKLNPVDRSRIDSVRQDWLFRMLHTKRPLQEKMALFWHGHFATANSKVNSALLMHRQIELFRRMALGNFRELVLEVSKDPAMLRWLDGNQNRKGAPNENYARELLELFTMGIGNYTEKDIKEAARAFTGWFMRLAPGAQNRPGQDNYEFFFDRNQHDFGPKTFLGETGPWDGGDIINIIFKQPATSRFIARKLFSFFAYENPEEATVERLAAVFEKHNFELKPLVRAIFKSPEFLSPRAYHALIKSPVEFCISLMRELGIAVPPTDLPAVLRRMGQDLLNPPTVKGWDGGAEWITSVTLLERFNFANRLVSGRTGRVESLKLDPADLEALKLTSFEALVDHFLDRFVERDVPDTTRRALLRYVKTGAGTFALTPAFVDQKVRGLIHLILCTPEYQLH